MCSLEVKSFSAISFSKIVVDSYGLEVMPGE